MAYKKAVIYKNWLF